MAADRGHIVVVGGTKGLGFAVAGGALARGYTTTITGRSASTAKEIADSLARGAVGRPCDLNDRASIEGLFDGIDKIDHLVLAAVDRDHNDIHSFRPEDCLRTLAAKTVGYATAVNCALDKFTDRASVVIFGGLSAYRPFPGSTTLSLANGAVVGLMNSLAVQIAPVRVNTITPGVVSDTWAVEEADPVRAEAYERLRERTPGKRLPSSDDIVQGTFALVDNRGLNAVELIVDSGMRIAT
jgi:NAD(P)-dependent dehydrogenase (short-subunit alcohol dehydrogenase family)